MTDQPLKGSGLRAQLEATIEENRALKAQLRSSKLDAAFTKVGLTAGHEWTKPMRELYDGEPDPDAIRTFAREEYGLELGGSDE